jgi:predicted nucleotidyltransferase
MTNFDLYLAEQLTDPAFAKRFRLAGAWWQMYGHTIRSYGKTERMNLLANLVCSRVRAEVFRVLFGLQTGELHLREIHRQTNLALGTVRQDIGKLVRLGLVRSRQDGNRIYYRANQRHPLYPDIHQMVLKTVGLTDVLAAVLRSNGIRAAFVFGSIARGTDSPESDVDLMIIGTFGLRKVSALLGGVAERLGREINPHVLSPSEFRERIRTEEHFLTSVLKSPKLFVLGSEHELEAMAKKRLAETAPDQPARGR